MLAFLKKNASGFTLMELTISMVMMVIVSGLLASIIAVNFSVMSDVSDRKKLVTLGLSAVNLFQREAGMIKKTADILVASENQFKFLDAYGNTWDYVISSNSLQRQQVGVGSAQILASPAISADTKFTYYAEDNTATTVIADIKLVKLMLVMDDGAGGIPVMSIVYPENFKFYNR
jgi:type II secretory pathway pseudopilin PulG